MCPLNWWLRVLVNGHWYSWHRHVTGMVNQNAEDYIFLVWNLDDSLQFNFDILCVKMSLIKSLACLYWENAGVFWNADLPSQIDVQSSTDLVWRSAELLNPGLFLTARYKIMVSSFSICLLCDSSVCELTIIFDYKQCFIDCKVFWVSWKDNLYMQVSLKFLIYFVARCLTKFPPFSPPVCKFWVSNKICPQCHVVRCEESHSALCLWRPGGLHCHGYLAAYGHTPYPICGSGRTQGKNWL